MNFKQLTKAVEDKYTFPIVNTDIVTSETINGLPNPNQLHFITVDGEAVTAVSSRYQHQPHTEIVDSIRKSLYESDMSYYPALFSMNSSKTNLKNIWVDPEQKDVDGEPYMFGLMLTYYFEQVIKIKPFIYRQWCSNGCIASVNHKLELFKIGHRGNDDRQELLVNLDSYIQNLKYVEEVIRYMKTANHKVVFTPVKFEDKGKERERFIMKLDGIEDAKDYLKDFEDQATLDINELYKSKYVPQDGENLYAFWNACTHWGTHMKDRTDNSRINIYEKVNDKIFAPISKLWTAETVEVR